MFYHRSLTFSINDLPVEISISTAMMIKRAAFFMCFVPGQKSHSRPDIPL